MRVQWFMLATGAVCMVLVLLSFVAESCAGVRGQVGWASWYGRAFHGRKTASGEHFSARELTAAHRKLPLGTKALVMNLETREQVEVKINDRGPFVGPERRIIDLSLAAADSIGLLERGVARVRVVVSEKALQVQDSTDAVFHEVQVGAFVDKGQAEAVRNQLRPRYPSAYTAARDGPLGRYYRVRVGPFYTRQDSQRMASMLKRQGYYVFLDEVTGSAFMAQRLRSAIDGAVLDLDQGAQEEQQDPEGQERHRLELAARD